jgi:zinc transporter 5/7
VNLIGLFFFHDADPHHFEDSGPKEEASKDAMRGVFLHALADSLGSLGVIISTILVKYYDITMADPICSFLVAAMILASSIPYIKSTALQLLLFAPRGLKKRLMASKEAILSIKGVQNC